MVVTVVLVGQLEVQFVADDDFSNNADPFEQLQGAVHGGEVNVGVLGFDLSPYFVGPHVAGTTGDNVQHG